MQTYNIMAKINKENLSLFRNADDLVDFITLHRFEPENANLILSDDFSELDESWKDIIYIYDFETFFDFYGLYNYLSHPNGLNIKPLISSFRAIGFDSISENLNNVFEILKQHDTSLESIQISNEERQKIEELEEEIEITPLQKDILQIEEEIRPYMEEKDYWEVLKEKVSFAKKRTPWSDD